MEKGSTDRSHAAIVIAMPHSGKTHNLLVRLLQWRPGPKGRESNTRTIKEV